MSPRIERSCDEDGASPGEGRLTETPTAVKAPIVHARRADAVPFIAEPSLLGMSFAWNLERKVPSYAVVAKATLDLSLPNGEASLREEGEPPTGDLHVFDPPMSSLRYASDIAVVKSRCDVLLWGHAFGRGRASTEVRFAFGDATRSGRGFDRRLRVHGPRKWSAGRPGKAEAYEKVPLLWELAAHHAQVNPVGRTHDGDMAPQIEVVDGGVSPGFGGIPLMWPSRLGRFGTYDERWYKTRFPFFAEDFDPSAYQLAPKEQQLDRIRGEEPFVLEGLHPDHRVIRGTLPKLSARVFAVGPSEDGGVFTEVPLRLDTVFFDLEELTITFVWRGNHAVADMFASDVSAWRGELLTGPPDEDALREAFWRRWDPEWAESLGQDEEAVAIRETAAAAVGDEVAMARHEKRARERLTEAGLDAALLAAERAEPPTAPAPRRWPPADQCIGRRLAEAWLAGGDEPGPGILVGAELSGLDFSGRDMSGFQLHGAHLERCRFIETNLTEAQLAEAVAREAMFDRATLDSADLTEADLTGCVLAGASLCEADLTGCVAVGGLFDEVKAMGAQFIGAELERASFLEAKLNDASFTEAQLQQVRFTKASLAGVRLYDANASGADFTGADLKEARADGVTMVKAICDGARGDDAVFDGADLTDVSWRKSSLRALSMTRAVALRARFIACDLRGAGLAKTTLAGADFRSSDLMEADLAEADLSESDFRKANLFGAELFGSRRSGMNTEGAIIGRTIIEGS